MVLGLGNVARWSFSATIHQHRLCPHAPPLASHAFSPVSAAHVLTILLDSSAKPSVDSRYRGHGLRRRFQFQQPWRPSEDRVRRSVPHHGSPRSELLRSRWPRRRRRNFRTRRAMSWTGSTSTWLASSTRMKCSPAPTRPLQCKPLANTLQEPRRDLQDPGKASRENSAYNSQTERVGSPSCKSAGLAMSRCEADRP